MEQAIKDLPNFKTAGIDGIHTEVFKTLWPKIGPLIQDQMEEALQQKQLHPGVNGGLQSLIPKGGARTNISNYRPISVLPSIYKIMAKTMANRMQANLPLWIKTSQTGFVKERYILDNVFLAYEAMEYARETKQDLVILMIDFEKAYDQVNWSFMKKAMKKMGFSSKWINWTAIFYQGAQTQILVNGQTGQSFEMERGVRQGCPMAPYMYLFVQDVLGHMISDPENGIEGLTMPDKSILKEAFFADDSTLYFKGTEENLHKAFSVLDAFCGGSGAKINMEKNIAIWASDATRTWTFGGERGLKWLNPGCTVLNLGFPMGYRMSQEEKNAKVLQQIRLKLGQWVNKPLSMAARILVTNQVVLASIWYIASCADLARSVLNRAKAMVHNFI
jgi:hypothetical protein